MTTLDEFIAEVDAKSKFIRFVDGEPVKGIYKGVKVTDDSFNPGSKTIEYTLEVDGVEKTFNSQSVKLARMMREMKEGKEVEIVRTGTAFDTIWYVGKAK